MFEILIIIPFVFAAVVGLVEIYQRVTAVDYEEYVRPISEMRGPKPTSKGE